MSRIHWLTRAAHGRLAVTLGATGVMVSAMAVANAQVQAHDPALPATGIAVGTAQSPAGQSAAAGQARAACAAPLAGQAACMAIIIPWKGTPPSRPTTSSPTQQASPAAQASQATAGDVTAPPLVQPLTPADLQAAYNLPSASRGSGATIAIVDAYDDPNAESDLATYRAQFGLPPCTADSGCFRKVAQDGSANYPPPDDLGDWEVEESLDLDMASAICPNCKLLLVEATDPSSDNLGIAVDEAVALHATAVSNSYGAPEDSTEPSFAKYYDHPGVAITAATGDWGFGVYYPAAYSSVVAVGGTTLYHDTGTARGWSEQAWDDAGSGCSVYIAKPAWQHDNDCAMRTVGDVAAVADIETPSGFTTGTTATGGRPPAVPASPRRSSPASTPWRATPPRSTPGSS